MECKSGPRRISGGTSKSSKSDDDSDNFYRRSNSFKAKDTSDYEDNDRDSFGLDYPSESKTKIKSPTPAMKEEKDDDITELNKILSTIDMIQHSQEEKADSEFEELMHKPNVGAEFTFPTDPQTLKVLRGFKM